jgi:hypothetical protein
VAQASVCSFCEKLPNLVFDPSDPELAALLSVSAWVKATPVANMRPPIADAKLPDLLVSLANCDKAHSVSIGGRCRARYERYYGG